MLFSIALLIPAHNEARWIGAKITATHAMQFPPPPAGREHLCIVIDDGSRDETLTISRDVIAGLQDRPGVRWMVIQNTRGRGKGSALLMGFEAAAGCDLFIITDVDAVVPNEAPVRTASVFLDPRVGVATGRQIYGIPGDSAGLAGSLPGGMDLYDEATGSVRDLESVFGMLFSVHGPWLAIRAVTGALPRAGVAADDLDLALQVRRSGFRSVRIPGLVFYEGKPSGEALQAQRLRRARAFFEVMDLWFWKAPELRPRPFAMLQFYGYALAPVGLSILVPLLAVAAVALVGSFTKNPFMAIAAALVIFAIAVVPAVSQCLAYARIILWARFSCRRAQADRWSPVAR